MIIGTAGHIDHGKTALVKALTGVDADRLAEEKRRGITIDLGFAYADAPDGTFGFVDVPGHERFVHTMLAGATGIDAALLVVALDDGVMPQTREHAAILDLLGIDRGVVALTKSDIAAGNIEPVTAEVRALLAATGLRDAAILPVSAITGDGIAALTRRAARAGAETTRHHRPSAPGGGSGFHADGRWTCRHRHAGRRPHRGGRPADAVAARTGTARAWPACAEPAPPPPRKPASAWRSTSPGRVCRKTR